MKKRKKDDIAMYKMFVILSCGFENVPARYRSLVVKNV